MPANRMTSLEKVWFSVDRSPSSGVVGRPSPKKPLTTDKRSAIPMNASVTHVRGDHGKYIAELVQANGYRMVVLQGRTGAGKSTAAKAAAGLLDKATVVEADDFFTDSHGIYMFHPSGLAEAHTAAQERAWEVLDEGGVVLVANTNTRRWQAEPYVQMARSFNVSTLIYTIRPLSMEAARKCAFRTVHNIPLRIALATFTAMEQLVFAGVDCVAESPTGSFSRSPN